MFNSTTSIEAAQRVVDQFKFKPQETLQKEGHSAMWEAQRIVRASTNADTREIIPLPFRLCGFVTFNMPILVGLCWPGIGTYGMMFWQWANQTHNAAVNYCNRNASNPTNPTLLGASYTAACAGGMGIAYSLQRFIATRPWPEVRKARLGSFISFPAVAVANTLNMAFMRSGELVDGIDVIDNDTGAVVGKSRVAAQKAVMETVLSRLIISAGVLFVPPLIMGKIEPKLELKYSGSALKNAKLGYLIGVCAACFYGVLPVSVAAFPQYRVLPRESLEEDLQKKTSAKTVTFNRGQ